LERPRINSSLGEETAHTSFSLGGKSWKWVSKNKKEKLHSKEKEEALGSLLWRKTSRAPYIFWLRGRRKKIC